MRAFPRSAQFYIWSLAAVAVAIVVISIIQFPVGLVSFRDLILFGTLSAIAGRFPVVLPRRDLEITASVAIDIAAVLLLPFSIAALVPMLGTLVTEILHRRVWYKVMFNVSAATVTYGVLSLLWRRFV